MIFEKPITTAPFAQWIKKDKENRRLIIFACIAIVIQFVIFKILYPFPNFMPPDSYSYLEAAWRNDFINMWAIGYSKFLRLFSSFTKWHIALVTFQYLFLEYAICYFLFSIRYLFSPGRWVFRILLVLNILNPLIPHIGNFVSSDALFTALALIWFTQLMWLLYLPSLRLAIGHAFILAAVFIVRYNALYFPIISVLIIGFGALPRKSKRISIGLVLLLIAIFIGRTQYEYKQRTDTIQFSAFGGWQLAANALYGYAHANEDSAFMLPEDLEELHKLVNHHMDSIRHLQIRPDGDVGIYYLWDFKSPLRVYMEKAWEKKKSKDSVSFFTKWASMGPLYDKYGRYLILHHPFPFIRYYLWPNFIKYYSPPTGFMGYYNLGGNDVEPIANAFFGFKNKKIQSRTKDQIIHIAKIFPIFLATINLLFLASIIAFLLLSGFKICSSSTRHILVWMAVIWISNMIFSVFAAPIELRYQFFPMVITFGFLVILLAYIVKQAMTSPNKAIIEKPYFYTN